MNPVFPSYKDLFDLTKRRLQDLKKIATNKNGTISDQENFLFLIIGNINLRFNTICLLLENNNFDGVFPLQRTIFELQLVFEAYIDSDHRDKFIELYNKKRDFESSIKWDRLLTENLKKETNIFSEKDQEIVAEMMSNIKKNLKDSTKDRVTKVWYELASGKTVKELSYEYLNELEYFINYDEPSNWVHPQRLEYNIDENFNTKIDENYFLYLVNMLRTDVKWISEDLAYIVKHLKIVRSPRFYKYGEKISNYDGKLRDLAILQCGNHISK
ncbi:TPA: hypothetical protein IXR49_001007 [Enterococcus faecium]|nr:hypothetical protein [Enterococcus faecium]HAQ4319464.1 hypothetical protein [Enterococcus faecium]HAQ5011457.1 hypothetical protein [Enterococcus faecium]HAQ5051362.1 hypothetical protein [Enterococcus faecium]HAQ5074117.1 hypothetical protein [Enterococcus faecium]